MKTISSCLLTSRDVPEKPEKSGNEVDLTVTVHHNGMSGFHMLQGNYQGYCHQCHIGPGGPTPAGGSHPFRGRLEYELSRIVSAMSASGIRSSDI
jgi:hypothetical protein